MKPILVHSWFYANPLEFSAEPYKLRIKSWMIHYEVEWFRTYTIELFCFPGNWNWFHEKRFDRVSRKKYILGFVVAVELMKGPVKNWFLKYHSSTLSAIVQRIFVFIFKFLTILTLVLMIISLTRCRCLWLTVRAPLKFVVRRLLTINIGSISD